MNGNIPYKSNLAVYGYKQRGTSTQLKYLVKEYVARKKQIGIEMGLIVLSFMIVGLAQSIVISIKKELFHGCPKGIYMMRNSDVTA